MVHLVLQNTQVAFELVQRIDPNRTQILPFPVGYVLAAYCPLPVIVLSELVDHIRQSLQTRPSIVVTHTAIVPASSAISGDYIHQVKVLGLYIESQHISNACPEIWRSPKSRKMVNSFEDDPQVRVESLLAR
jgi:hypothetical protein